MMTRFVVPKDKDLNELVNYKFVDEKTDFVYWQGTRRISVNKKTRKISFNSITNEIVALIIKLVEDKWVKVINYNHKLHSSHYIGLDDEEYKIIMERRIANGEIDYCK